MNEWNEWPASMRWLVVGLVWTLGIAFALCALLIVVAFTVAAVRWAVVTIA